MIQAEKQSMIQRSHPKLSISQQCKLVNFSQSSFYYMPVGLGSSTLTVMEAIDRAFIKYPFFGSCQSAPCQRRKGIVVSPRAPIDGGPSEHEGQSK